MRLLAAVSATLALLLSAHAWAGEFITVTSTTSTQNSGLFEDILPKFTAKTGIEVRVVAVGTGQAIKIAQRGDADVLFVHHRPSEDAFVAEGNGVKRLDVMMNDFLIVGPAADPAGVKGAGDAVDALMKIMNTSAPFVSRGDDSGTHKRELGLWKAAGLDPKAHSGTWYREAGAGMGATLNMAQAMGAYAIADRGTWIAFKNKDGLDIAHQGTGGLLNPYGVILVNPERHPHVKAGAGQAFIDWLVSDEGQAAIAAFQIDGQQLFFPTAGK
ncbi:MAG: extracellular solute-binding protein [Alphaproteobacteria bacterium]|nr:extracellular solute-binding protein [Alphaproteobacteria bacterium]